MNKREVGALAILGGSIFVVMPLVLGLIKLAIGCVIIIAGWEIIKLMCKDD